MRRWPALADANVGTGKLDAAETFTCSLTRLIDGATVAACNLLQQKSRPALGTFQQSLLQLAATVATRSSATAEVTLFGGHYAVQGHARSLILVPIESPYATSY